MCESKLICVTNRKLCQTDFLTQIQNIAAASPKAILLREKDLPQPQYRLLARQVLKICSTYRVPCILHTYADAAADLNANALHLPLPLLRQLPDEKKAGFAHLGASCHSIEDAKEAEALGCTYITAGHIFATDCKKGIPPRGILFLEEICQAIHIPVFAIGGITKDNWQRTLQAGAAGVCMMGKAMACKNPSGYLKQFCTDIERR